MIERLKSNETAGMTPEPLTDWADSADSSCVNTQMLWFTIGDADLRQCYYLLYLQHLDITRDITVPDFSDSNFLFTETNLGWFVWLCWSHFNAIVICAEVFKKDLTYLWLFWDALASSTRPSLGPTLSVLIF